MNRTGSSSGPHLSAPATASASLLGQREAASICSMTHAVAPKLHIAPSPTDSGFKEAIGIAVDLLYLNGEIPTKVCGNPVGLILK